VDLLNIWLLLAAVLAVEKILVLEQAVAVVLVVLKVELLT
jgi:hypothetical protein